MTPQQVEDLETYFETRGPLSVGEMREFFRYVKQLQKSEADKDNMIAVLCQDRDVYRQGLHDGLMRGAARARNQSNKWTNSYGNPHTQGAIINNEIARWLEEQAKEVLG